VRATYALLVLLVLCACHRSGTWVDDPKNFERAWGSKPPAGLRIVHSWYWRSAHFTREERYYFHFAAHPGLAESFAAENGLRRTDASAINVYTFDNDRPAWFAPRPPEFYEIWLRSEGSFTSSAILRDKATGETILFASQL
jgi:hypothetical protein